MTVSAETQLNVWYCNRCRKACKIQPPLQEPACKCSTPVPGLRPTLVTLIATPKRRPMQALTDEEARLRNLVRKNQRVRITYEAEVVEAWTCSDKDGVKYIQFMVATPDGRRHAVDPRLPGVHVEGLPRSES